MSKPTFTIFNTWWTYGLNLSMCKPLHHVARASQCYSTKIIKYYLQLFPQSVQVKAKDGYVPLLLALQSGPDNDLCGPKIASLEEVKVLVEARPESIGEKTEEGLLPLQFAAMSDVPLCVLFYLATTYPEAVSGAHRTRTIRNRRKSNWPFAAPSCGVP
jgi:hypothetical protein